VNGTRKAVKLGVLLIALMTGVGPTSTLNPLLPLAYGTEKTSLTPISKMTMTLRRLSYSKHGTFGELTLSGGKKLYTLEETEAQIPPGTYPIELTFSPRFHRLLPLLSVPGRSEIRIHVGNWPRDSSGCILIGTRKGKDMILGSQATLDPLILQIQAVLAAHGSVAIVIS
jgi:hypothetical protein